MPVPVKDIPLRTDIESTFCERETRPDRDRVEGRTVARMQTRSPRNRKEIGTVRSAGLIKLRHCLPERFDRHPESLPKVQCEGVDAISLQDGPTRLPNELQRVGPKRVVEIRFRDACPVPLLIEDDKPCCVCLSNRRNRTCVIAATFIVIPVPCFIDQYALGGVELCEAPKGTGIDPGGWCW